jgi:type VI secretion system protein ImpJ
MTIQSKVLWGEGLFLRPQHFQQQDQYHEYRLHQTALALHPYSWGVIAMQCDKDALSNNVLRLSELSIIFQDGEMVKAPTHDDLPAAINLAELPLAQQSVTFYVALPVVENYGGNFSSANESDDSARYAQKNIDTPDLYTKAINAELTYLKKTVRLVSEFEPRDSYISFPLLRIRRTSTGGFEQDVTFVAPSVSIKSAPQLFVQLRKLLDSLQAKVNALYGHHREPSKNVIEFRSGDVSSFWLLHTASSAFASLSHYLHNPNLHPERLYEQLLGLAGALLTYSKSSSLSDLPAYNHQDPGPCFSKLHNIVRELLDTVISAKYFAITLSEVKPSYHHGVLDSEKITKETNFYIAVSAELSPLELVDIVPLRFKIGAPDDVEKFVLSAMPGVRLSHSPQVPAAVPVRPDTFYFAIDAKGPMYDRMIQAQSVSIYVPSGIRNLKLELLAVTA